ATAALIFHKGNLTEVTDQERVFTVARLFDLQYLESLPHDQRELTSKIDYFSSLLVNALLLSDWQRGSVTQVSHPYTQPNGQLAFYQTPRFDSGNAYHRFIERFASGDIGGQGLMPAPTTVGFVPFTSFARVLREIPGTKGAYASVPFPLSAGPSMSSLI